MSLKTALNASDFEAPALNEHKSEASQAPAQSQSGQAPNQTPSQAQEPQKQNEPAIPYPRFQEVTHENQALRAQVQEYQQRIAQAQQQNQMTAPISGMQGNPNLPKPNQQLNAQDQQHLSNFREQLQDPNKVKEWQSRIAKEGPIALQEFVDQVVRDTGSQLLGDYIQPLLQKVALLEGDYVSNSLNQYASNVTDPEFPAYRHLFEQAIRQVAPHYNIKDPQVLDTVRNFAAAQYRTQYGHAPQVPQGQQVPQPNTFQQPPVSERPGNSFGFPAQGSTQNKYAAIDTQLAQRMGLDPALIQANRARTVRGG